MRRSLARIADGPRRTPSLESIFGAFTKAVRTVDQSKLDHAKLEELSQHPDLLKVLDSWVLAPDRELVPALKRLGEIVTGLYGFRKDLVLYRGFDPNKRYQDLMGLSKANCVGDRCDYRLHSPLSFSTEEGIAEAFGPTLVRTMANPAHTPMLVITDELSTLVSRLRNINPETQKEVILFPPTNIDFVILKR